MKCFLHVGTEKTATTTLQDFFHINREKLSKINIIYPTTAGTTNSILLPLASYSLNRRDDITRQYGIKSARHLLQHQKIIMKELKKEIDCARENHNTIIFSSEHIQSRLTTLDELKRLQNNLTTLGITETSIIIYLRRPADTANALYSTAIKSGQTIDAPPPPTSPYFNNVCNHKNTIEKFSAIFGKDSIIPKIFDDDAFKNGSIIDDILDVIGIPNFNYTPPKKRMNKSLSTSGIRLLRDLNAKHPELTNNTNKPLQQKIVHLLEDRLSDQKYIMPESKYEEYDAAFLKSDNWVREHYFPQRKSLFSYETRKCENPTPTSAKEILKIKLIIKKMLNPTPTEKIKNRAKVVLNKIKRKAIFAKKKGL